MASMESGPLGSRVEASVRAPNGPVGASRGDPGGGNRGFGAIGALPHIVMGGARFNCIFVRVRVKT